MRRRAKVDDNQKDIVKQLRKLGYCVSHTHMIGEGFPDIIVGARQRNFLFEIKDGSKPKSRRKLTEDEVNFHSAWCGQIDVIESIEDAIKIINQAA